MTREPRIHLLFSPRAPEEHSGPERKGSALEQRQGVTMDDDAFLLESRVLAAAAAMGKHRRARGWPEDCERGGAAAICRCCGGSSWGRSWSERSSIWLDWSGGSSRLLLPNILFFVFYLSLIWYLYASKSEFCGMGSGQVAPNDKTNIDHSLIILVSLYTTFFLYLCYKIIKINIWIIRFTITNKSLNY